ncbi:MAG: hypothetical protein MJ252_15345 [archaeon]|nr:hypothetical protein [archaeon]
MAEHKSDTGMISAEIIPVESSFKASQINLNNEENKNVNNSLNSDEGTMNNQKGLVLLSESYARKTIQNPNKKLTRKTTLSEAIDYNEAYNYCLSLFLERNKADENKPVQTNYDEDNHLMSCCFKCKLFCFKKYRLIDELDNEKNFVIYFSSDKATGENEALYKKILNSIYFAFNPVESEIEAKKVDDYSLALFFSTAEMEIINNKFNYDYDDSKKLSLLCSLFILYIISNHENYLDKTIPVFQEEGAPCNLLLYMMVIMAKFTFYFTKQGNLNIFFNQKNKIEEGNENNKNKEKLKIEDVNRIIKEIVEVIEDSPSSAFWGYNVFINDYPIVKDSDDSWD